MPLALPGRIKDAVVAVPASADWRAGVERFLHTLTDDGRRVERHLALLDERLAGRLLWTEVFADATLPDGRPMPPGRRYAETLVAEERLPLYQSGPLRFSLDLHNPGNEAGVLEHDPAAIELALVADLGYFADGVPDSTFPVGLAPEERARRRAQNGAILGDLVARLCEATDATFACADVGETGWVVSSAQRPTSVVRPAPAGVRPTDFLWSISAWSPDLLRGRFGDRLERLRIDDAMLARIDRVYRPYFRIERRHLATGGLFLQYRFLFGTEARGERPAIDTPLAKQAGLRSTNLLFRA